MSDAPIPRVAVTSITSNAGEVAELHSTDIVVVVGPNNSGKSAFLKDIQHRLMNSRGLLVLSDIKFALHGTSEEFAARLEKSGKRIASGAILYSGHAEAPEWYVNMWNHIPQFGLQQLGNALLVNLTAESRLSAANPVAPGAFASQPPGHPLHYLFLSEKLELEMSQLFHRAFGTDLVVNRLGGTQITLHVGERPTLGKNENLLSDDYARAVEQLPMLHLQGDGVRSFTGVVLNAFSGDHDVLIIDEPEAFLHPPQARLLGQVLARSASRQRQLFLATHSGDFLRGVISANTDRLRILRLKRTENINHVSELTSDSIRILWQDPILRHSNALDGLFHEMVIVCEGDADCRFFSAVSDAILTVESCKSIRDAMLIHCGGKSRIPVLVRALRSLDVDVRVVVDFDALREEQPLHDIYEGLGGDWTEIRDDWVSVKKSIDEKSPELKTSDVVLEIKNITSGIADAKFPEKAADDIRNVLKRSSPWSIAKQTGKQYVPAGNARQTYERLAERLRARGMHLVEVGELESFDRSVGGHGPRWVNQVVGKDLASDPGLENARQFVRTLMRRNS